MIDVNPYLRKLAKNNYYQSLYSCSKEMGGIQIFANTYDFTMVQLNFLSYIAMYHSISMDVAMGDVDEKVLENDIYEDSYMHYKREHDVKEMKKKIKASPAKQENENVTQSSHQWVLKRGEGKK